MANASIKAAFEQFWQHVIARTGEMITTANNYTDTKVSAAQTTLNTSIGNKMDKTNPSGTGTLSINRKSGTTIGNYSVALGDNTTASGDYSFAMGSNVTATGDGSVAIGAGIADADGNNPIITNASGTCSVAIGAGTTSSGMTAFAEGGATVAAGDASHAEGYMSKTSSTSDVLPLETPNNDYIYSGFASHAEGYGTVALGFSSHSEGCGTYASSRYSHAEGQETATYGYASHAEGYNTSASGNYSHAGGYYTIANKYQYTIGKYNSNTTAPTGLEDTTANAGIFIVGIGTSDTTRSNGFRINPAGKPYALGSIATSGADYAEYFEWIDSNPVDEDRRGRFVTLDGNKIRYATADDDYILGVISAEPTIVGDIQSEIWHNMYLKDVYGNKLIDIVEVEETIDEHGEVIPAHVERRWILNPDYDHNKEYISREERSEWDAVGIVGKLVVMDDGTCEVNGYCYPSINGIATTSETKTAYRVIERLDDTHVKIFIK